MAVSAVTALFEVMYDGDTSSESSLYGLMDEDQDINNRRRIIERGPKRFLRELAFAIAAVMRTACSMAP